MYIQYTMDQLCLPMDLEEDIPENHLVRVVNAAVNRLDDTIFAAAYPDSYHPEMLTKVIIYAYTQQQIYSSRQIAKALEHYFVDRTFIVQKSATRPIPQFGIERQ